MAKRARPRRKIPSIPPPPDPPGIVMVREGGLPMITIDGLIRAVDCVMTAVLVVLTFFIVWKTFHP